MLRLLALAIALALGLTACGALDAGPGNDAAPFNSEDETFLIVWSDSDDPGDLVEDLQFEGFEVDVALESGEGVNSSEVSECLLVSVNPAGSVEVGELIEVVVDCGQRDWDDRNGDAWEAFAAAYAEGYEDGCEELFDGSPDGSLYLDGLEYTSIDCPFVSELSLEVEQAASIPSEIPDAPELEGERIGRTDGCSAMLDSVGGALYYGYDEFNETYCQDWEVAGYFPDDPATPVLTSGFQSPTGNIRCAAASDLSSVTCFVASLGRSATLTDQGQAFEGTTAIPSGQPTLAYGAVWIQSIFTCESSVNGILCAANVGTFNGQIALARQGIITRSEP